MQTYGKDAVKTIIGGYLREWAVIKDNGVWLSETSNEFIDPTQVVHWKYACELDGPDTPDPLEAPCLRIPCAANELAAFMLDGIGAMLPTIYGGWEDGPYQSMLDGMGILGNKPREALRAAYQAYREAEAVVGKMDATLEILKQQLAEEFEQKNGEANTREGVFAPDTSREESRARRERARASVQELHERSNQADAAYLVAFLAWRKAMVNQLLHPKLPVTRSDLAAMVIALPAGTKCLAVADIPTLIAVAKYPRMLAEGRLPAGAQALSSNEAGRMRNVQLYKLEREHGAELNQAIGRSIRGEAGGLPLYSSRDGRRCPSLDQARDCYVAIDDFERYVADTFHGKLKVRVDDGEVHPAAEIVAGGSLQQTTSASNMPTKMNWRHAIQAEAYEHWIRLRASGCNPSVNSICEDMATWCQKHDVRGGKGQNPRAGTIRNTVLGAGHWSPPNLSIAQAKEHVAQIARTAQSSAAQTAR